MVYYGRALRLKANHRNSIIGAGQTLRDRGQKGRLHQLLIRWHIICRPQSTRRIVYTGDIYIRSWEFYKSGQATSLPIRSEVKPMRASTPMHVTSLLVTEDRSDLIPLHVGTFGEDKEDLKAG
ncbi:hypothetical protein J6590_040079 [Homalodisca vitripennis]|nr:hypothetical protein J6590_040079 [Homalodisca vitripennis]